ncbi:acyltransferase-domain-containing protein [Metschnikowia bicuspidata var. bicuspidata NRRL YB-4993]|uniref:Acyltransferase-domain-containing protein n=1 Tax=Metschnikowia bicuspidata var. bicuspidata NRRL YB-4993 TaxID=869754 RepID=A0A1A0H9J5_9ASCO|nr:acyltransferase-domain-containing protein [Metschnikowia bicuspidata var. bicuspidata NRRL YB-4993]OBA20548.1 acyltransferase-domain-containing protein [Metschnikowia bicuspidata var. bicuspidata NRRL YB-4993]
MLDLISNSEFDVNILEDALTSPNLELTFPLPSDKKTYLPMKSNEEVSRSFQLLEHFINYFTRINVFDIYKNAEYRYSVHKASKRFNSMSELFMNDRLEHSDKKLDEIVYDLVDLELRMNLIKAKDFPRRFTEVKNFMINYYKQENLKNLPRFGSYSFIRLCYITVIKTVTKMFPQGVWTNREQFSNLYKTYLHDPMSIVLLPNHQSHIDYVILHLILIRFQMSLPTVIAGDNLNVAIFGSILKGLGGIFIKRSFNNEAYTERNLTNYVEFVLLNKIHFEVFIEGTRSRDGKLLLPKYGILKTLASIYQKQRKENENAHFDFLIQPVSITYERIYEADGYLHELIGKDKKQESFISIMSNGVTNMISRNDRKKVTYLSDGFVDNSSRPLNGKIFVTLAKNFTYSSYYNDPKNMIDLDQVDAVGHEQNTNLKKLGFKILHSINDISYIPESALIGFTVQTFYYYDGRKEFFVKELLPMMNLLTAILEKETVNASTIGCLKKIQSLTEDQKVSLIESQIVKIFRYTKVNPHTKRVRVVNSFELLYYKNLTIHLIIHKCLVSLILLITLNEKRISQLYYIFTGVLKNEFLFDYDYNARHELSNILKEFKDLNLISDSFEILDVHYHTVLATIVRPFIGSFAICIESLSLVDSQSFANCNAIPEQQLIDDASLLKDYPTTKSLLKIIQKDNLKNFENDSASYHVETYNKQYLLSFLFYLNNLKIIKILKNKSKTKAYVMIKNPSDLYFISGFMNGLKANKSDDSSINYMIDIVDKNFDRIFPGTTSEARVCKL